MTSFTLKLIAILTMLVDHLGFALFPEQLWMRVVGRLALPIFAFMVAQGVRLTHDRKRYLVRLLLWAAATEIPYDLMCYGSIFSMEGANVLWTLAAGAGCCMLLEQHKPWRWPAIITIMLLSTVLVTDYMFPGIVAIMVIYYYEGKGKRLRGLVWACIALTAAFLVPQIFCFAAILPLYYYNGQQGPRMKYLFYAFYPVHMLVLWGIAMLLQGGLLL